MYPHRRHARHVFITVYHHAEVLSQVLRQRFLVIKMPYVSPQNAYTWAVHELFEGLQQTLQREEDELTFFCPLQQCIAWPGIEDNSTRHSITLENKE